MATAEAPVLMDGSALFRRVLEDTARRACEFTRRAGRRPCLATVLVEEVPASVTYVNMKRRTCARTGGRLTTGALQPLRKQPLRRG